MEAASPITMDRAGTPGSRAATPGSRAATPGSGGRVDFAEGSGGTLADQWSTPMKARGSSPYKVPQSGGMDFEPPTSDFSGRGTSRDGSLRRRSAQPEKDPDAVFGSQRSRAAELRSVAEAGDGRSAVLLGYLYFDIDDRDGAEAWWTKGAAKHDAEAHFALGMLCGTSPEASSPEGAAAEAAAAAAARHFSRAAKQGHVVAAYHLGSAYAAGRGVAKDLKIAERFLRTAATAGEVGAMNALGAILEATACGGSASDRVSVDVPEDVFDDADDDDGGAGPTYVDRPNGFDEADDGGKRRKRLADAALWYGKAAKAGDRSAMANLGRMHYLGRGVPKDPNKALDVWLLAADQGCRVSCTNAAALLARKAADDPAEAVLALEAERLMLQAAELDHATARFNIAVLRATGLGDVVRNEAESVKQLRLAAAGGEPAAALALGDAYAAGVGVARRSDREAFKMYKQAAAANEPDGQYRLGLCYELGRGAQPDLAAANRCYAAAAKGGNMAAATKAGNLQSTFGRSQFS
jgi:hypothetical protein